MQSEPMRDRTAGLRPLRAAQDAVATLSGGDLQAQSAAVLRVTDACEAVLRRWLRDDDAVPLEVRLRALAPDELPAEQVVTELRQRDGLSIEAAASFHELLGARRRLAGGAPATPREVEVALALVRRLEAEARVPSTPPRAAAPPPEPVYAAGVGTDETLLEPVPLQDAPSRVRWTAVAGALLAVLLVAAVVWWAMNRRGAGLDEGIAAFRSGSYAQAADHFRRYAERHPDDATARIYLARIYRRARQYERAAAELRRGLEASPDDAGLRREVGYLLLDTGRARQAVEHFRRSVADEPAATDGWVGLIQALRASGQLQAAQQVLARAPAEVRALVTQRGGGAVPPPADALPDFAP